jgi:hypothetical protein
MGGVEGTNAIMKNNSYDIHIHSHITTNTHTHSHTHTHAHTYAHTHSHTDTQTHTSNQRNATQPKGQLKVIKTHSQQHQASSYPCSQHTSNPSQLARVCISGSIENLGLTADNRRPPARPTTTRSSRIRSSRWRR